MLNQKDILQTQDMIDKRHLDIRTITMGISLLDCCDPDLKTCCDKIYRKITRCAKDLVKVGEDIEKEFGIPIVNKRISVTPISIVAGHLRRQLHRRLFRSGAEGLHHGRLEADPLHPRGHGCHRAGVRQRECWLYQSGHQHGCRCGNGSNHQENRRADCG